MAKKPTERTAMNDVEVAYPPEDSISEIAFSPTNNHLAVASWDSKVRIYEVSQTGNSKPLTWLDYSQSVLSCGWTRDGTKVAAAGLDNHVKVMDVASGQIIKVGQHDAPISRVRMIVFNGNPMAISGSWDKTLKYWDLRSPDVAGSLACNERIYAMDVSGSRVVAGLANREVNVLKFSDPTRISNAGNTKLPDNIKGQIRSIACHPNDGGYALTTSGGKCRIQYFDDPQDRQTFGFSCHRKVPQEKNKPIEIHSVNSVSLHPNDKVCATGGSDGIFNFWNYYARSRMASFPAVGESIIATSYNHTGDIFAYGISYDWSKGYASHRQNSMIKVMLHPVAEDEKMAPAKPLKSPLSLYRRPGRAFK